jgi:hypothetical protein
VAVKLHRCKNVWIKVNGHPCWRVQKELDNAGVDYELVLGPVLRRNRDEHERVTGSRFYPVIEFEDGTFYREESQDMAERIKAGQLLTRDQAAAGGPTSP